ncbi:PepSY domain-containing protein [Paenibacillus agilis]|uniref:PepSY domain-containing protein n=1 Tax=Paenibacillus agilis TaxID=3020863 RepID=A0A559J2W1_9BACL|nr:PepSY domain-containing protein [Paenibacillus agilis]TVX94225.1 hypothetical protein FPZ44_14905 [Paenibacillus agilis]
MKKWAATTLAGALVLSGIGLGNNVMAKENDGTSKPAPAAQTTNNNSKAKISLDSAKKIATGLFKNAKIEEIELEKKNGLLVYHVEFENRKDKEDEVYIDAYTGKVTWEKDFNDDDDDNKQKQDKNNNTSSKDSKNNKPNTKKNDDDDNDDKDDDDNKKPTKPKQNNKPSKPSTKITKEQAIKIALTKVPGKVEEVELEKENNKLVYEVEIKAKKKNNDDDDAKVYVSATDGKVLKVKWDD